MYYEELGKTKIIKSLLIGTLFGIIICTILTVAVTVAFVNLKSIPTNYINIISIIFCTFSSFFAGFIAVRLVKCKGLLYGVLTACLLFFVLVATGICVNNGGITPIFVTKGIAMIVSGGIGGIFAVNKKQKIK